MSDLIKETHKLSKPLNTIKGDVTTELVFIKPLWKVIRELGFPFDFQKGTVDNEILDTYFIKCAGLAPGDLDEMESDDAIGCMTIIMGFFTNSKESAEEETPLTTSSES